ncbi:MAG: response regulator [Planctomycetes bacterium]|nr:response regulator [Planctomycetota bacterium]
MRSGNILLVEDNPAESWLFREAMKMNGWNIKLHVAADGLQALAYLQETICNQGRSRPDLILLDLNLPRKDGWQLLADIKAHKDFRSIPVFILTKSSDAGDICKAYDMLASCFIRKPVELNKFCEMVGQICRFWMDAVQLPGN